eukprot:scaffold346_cov347-Pavlova_lutheri.AAC.41
MLEWSKGLLGHRLGEEHEASVLLVQASQRNERTMARVRKEVETSHGDNCVQGMDNLYGQILSSASRRHTHVHALKSCSYGRRAVVQQGLKRIPTSRVETEWWRYNRYVEIANVWLVVAGHWYSPPQACYSRHQECCVWTFSRCFTFTGMSPIKPCVGHCQFPIVHPPT